MKLLLVLSVLTWTLVQNTTGTLLDVGVGGYGGYYQPVVRTPTVEQMAGTVAAPNLCQLGAPGQLPGACGCQGYSIQICPFATHEVVEVVTEVPERKIAEIIDVRLVDETTGQILGEEKEAFEVTRQFYPYGQYGRSPVAEGGSYYPTLFQPPRHPQMTGGFGMQSSQPQMIGGFGMQSSHPQMIGGFGMQSSQPQMTGGFGMQSSQPQMTGGFGMQSSQPQMIGGFGMQSSHPQMISGFGMQSAHPQMIGGFGMQSAHPQMIGGFGMPSTQPQMIGGFGMQSAHPQMIGGFGMPSPQPQMIGGFGMQSQQKTTATRSLDD